MFTATFDGVSEFTSSQLARFRGAVTGFVSFSGIIVVYLLALWQNDWAIPPGWLLAVVGSCHSIRGYGGYPPHTFLLHIRKA